MKDLARLVGVSQATVSNAFNRPDQLSEALRERILSAARTVGYPGPDPLANTFRRGTTGALGLIIHEPLQYLFEDTAARLTMTGLARACQEHGLSLVLVPRAEPGTPDVVSTALVDGFVAFCDPLEDERRELLRTRGLPVVGLDAPISDGAPYAGIDDRAAAAAAAAHVAGLGHRRVGIITFPLHPDGQPGLVAEGLAAGATYRAAGLRLRGYRDALSAVLAAGGQVTVAAAAGVEEADGARAAAALLESENRPTVILAMGDRLALGALAHARSLGICVPRDLSVAGFDDIPEAATADPPLTSVAQPHAEKGAMAVRLLLGTEPKQPVRPLQTSLIVRGSTAAAPRPPSR
jgi:DNA-binding LacI/PurR family transcriptional regulator